MNGNCTFSQIQPRCPVCHFCTLSTPGGSRGEVPWFSREKSSQPRAGQRASRTFFSASLRAAGVATSQGGFSGRGLGRSKGSQTFRPGLHPRPRAPRREFQLLATSCPHVSPNTRDTQSLQGSPKRLGGDCAGSWWQGRGGGERGAGSGGGAARSRPGGGTGSRPGSGGRAAGRAGPRARQEEGAAAAAARSACPRPGRRGRQLTPPAAPPPQARASVPDCARGRAGWCRRRRRGAGRARVRVGAREGFSKLGRCWAGTGILLPPLPRFPAPEAVVNFLPGGSGRGEAAPRPGRVAGTEPFSHSPNLSVTPLTTFTALASSRGVTLPPVLPTSGPCQLRSPSCRFASLGVECAGEGDRRDGMESIYHLELNRDFCPVSVTFPLIWPFSPSVVLAAKCAPALPVEEGPCSHPVE